MKLALGHVLRHCPARSTTIGRQRDLVLKRHDQNTQQRADAELDIVV